MQGMQGIGGINKPNKMNTIESPDSTAQQITSGFIKQNTILHEGKSPLELTGSDYGKVRLPEPQINMSDVNHRMGQELENADLNFPSGMLDPIEDENGNQVPLSEILNQTIQNESGVDDKIPTDLEQLLLFEEQASDVFIKLSAIEEMPDDVSAKLKGLEADLAHAMSTGNIEDVQALLARMQTELKDTRIKFDQESLHTAKLARQQTHTERVAKLSEAIKQFEEQKAAGIFGKIFGTIATVLSIVVGSLLIATGVLSKAGIALMVASMALMALLTISQHSGNFMNKIFGDDKTAQMIAGIMWSILAAGLSLGASVASIGKSATDAAQQGANLARMIAMAKQMGKIARMGQASATLVAGASDIHAARKGYEGSMFKADATDDLAFMMKMQNLIDDLVEAIQRAMKEIGEGQEIAVKTVSESFKSKSIIARNI